MASAPTTIAVNEEGVTLAADQILTGRGFITGKSGSGKSNTASVIIEELLEIGFPVMVLDTDGEYYGLGESYAILHAGAGEDVDRTVDASNAAELAVEALNENRPIVLDLSGFIDEDEVDAIVEAVVKKLFVLEDSLQKPFLLFVEEIHEFLPQQGGHGDVAELLVRVAKRGRKRGLGVCGLSQRPAAVDKEFITQCDWMVWHRLTWDNDTAVVGRILGDAYETDVQDLATGEAFLMTDWDSQIQQVTFRPKHSLDAGATPDLEDVDRADLTKGTPARSASPSQQTDAPSQPTSDTTPDREDPSPEPITEATDDTEPADRDRRAWNDERSTFDPVWEFAALCGRGLRWIGRGLARLVPR